MMKDAALSCSNVKKIRPNCKLCTSKYCYGVCGVAEVELLIASFFLVLSIKLLQF